MCIRDRADTAATTAAENALWQLAESSAVPRFWVEQTVGDTVYAYINGTLVTSYTDANPMLSGRVKISSNWTQVYACLLYTSRCV